MAFWPSLIWMLIIFYPLKGSVKNFFTAKIIGVFIMVGFIPAVFFSYTPFVGDSILAVDIGSFVAAVIIGQLASYKLYKRRFSQIVDKVAIAALVLLAVLFVIFTFYPPHLLPFQDSQNGLYGIIP